MGKLKQEPWYRQNPDLLTGMVQEALEEFPDLRLGDDQGLPVLRGRFPIVFEEREVESFDIEVRLPEHDPNDVPILREIGGRIPRKDDFHVNNPDGDTCLFVPDERWRVFPRGAGLLQFLKGPVRTHLIGASLRLGGEPWPSGERPHGEAGVYQYYSELLGTDNRNVILSYIRILATATMKRHWACPCASGRQIRKCHDNLIADLREKIPARDALRTLRYLETRPGM